MLLTSGKPPTSSGTQVPSNGTCVLNSAIISIHDVTPQTLPDVTALVMMLQGLNLSPFTLLVVPGARWNQDGLEVLFNWQDAGYRLAGHGWDHKSTNNKSLTHKIHSAIISQNAAEHLSKRPGQIFQIIRHSYDWFNEVGLEPPDMYVPPSWAMGSISRTALPNLPFRFYETLTGIYDVRLKSFRRLPLVGFEADSPLRARILRFFNSLNRVVSHRLRIPCRVAIHPQDLRLRLASELRYMLDGLSGAMNYSDVFDDNPSIHGSI